MGGSHDARTAAMSPTIGAHGVRPTPPTWLQIGEQGDPRMLTWLPRPAAAAVGAG